MKPGVRSGARQTTTSPRLAERYYAFCWPSVNRCLAPDAVAASDSPERCDGSGGRRQAVYAM